MAMARTIACFLAELRFIVERTPRVAGVRFVDEVIIVLIADAYDRFEIVLPAVVRKRLVVDLGQLIDLELERPITRCEVEVAHA
jgi:hypothetical protein